MSGSNTPIVDIPVNSDKFEKFIADFEKHKASLGALPGVWEAINNTQKKSLGVLGGIAEQLNIINQSVLANVAATNKNALGQEKMKNQVTATAHGMESLSRWTGRVTRDLAEGVTSLLKWSALTGAVGGLLGAGSLWGLDRLAAAAGGDRRAALGLGVSTPQMLAFENTYARLISPDQVLGSVVEAQSNPASMGRVAFSTLGIRDYQTADAAHVALETLDAVRAFAKRTPKESLGAMYSAYQIGSLGYSLEDVRRIGNTDDAEYGQLRARYGKEVAQFQVDPNNQEKWQDFLTTLGESGTKIKQVLIDGLAPLAGPLSDLSKSVAEVIKAFLSAPELKVWIKDASDGLERFAKFIGTPDFDADIQSFVRGVGEFATAISNAVKWIYGHLPDSITGAGQSSDWQSWHRNKNLAENFDSLSLDTGLTKWQVDNANGMSATKYARMAVAHDYFASKGWNEAQIAGILAGGDKESGWNPTQKGGVFQWDGDRYNQYIKDVGKPPEQTDIYTQIAYAQFELEHNKRTAADQLRATRTPEDAYTEFRKYFEVPKEEYRVRDEPSGRAEAGGFYGQFGNIGSRALQSPAPVTVYLQLHSPTSLQVATGAAQGSPP